MRPTAMSAAALVLAAVCGNARGEGPGPSASQEAVPAAKYGPKDIIGAANNLSADGVLRAAKLVRAGKVYSLAIPTTSKTPTLDKRHYAAEIIPAPGAEAPAEPGKNTGYDERISTSMGIGTSIDGIGHIGINHVYYGRRTPDDVHSQGGMKLDTSNIPPIVTRGVLINLAKYFGKPTVEAGHDITRHDIEGAMKAQALTLGKGDVVLLHTGWMKFLDTDRETYLSKRPGLSAEGAQWLADLGVVVVGSDTASLGSPAHRTLITKNGVYLMEYANTTQLAADGVDEFLVVIGQPRFVGTAQIVLNPIAIR